MSNFQKIKIMKKFFFTAAVAVSGLVMVSCEADAIDSTSPQAKDFEVQKKGLEFNKRDALPLFNSSTMMASEGPGDEIIIITPPKKQQ
jgi:hypothetical protein